MFERLWSRVKKRRHCEHNYVLLKRYENAGVEPFSGGALRAGRISVYRCELCGKKKWKRD